MKSVKLLFLITLLFSVSANAQWTKLIDGYSTDMDLKDVYVNANGQKITAVGYDAPGFQNYVFKSTNAGASWDTLHLFGPGLLFVTIAFNTPDTGYIGGFGANSLWVQTTDGGANWNNAFGDPAYSGVTDIMFLDNKRGFAGAYGATQFTSGHCYYTKDGGLNWEDQNNAGPSPLDSLSLENIFFVDVKTGYARSSSLFATEGYILKTTDTGKTWSIIRAQNSVISGIYFWNVNNGIYADENGRIYKTSDGGVNWIQKTTPPSSGLLTSISFANNNLGYACGYNGIVLKTTDGGETWAKETSVTSNHLMRVKFFNGKAYIVGNGGIILRSGAATGVAELPLAYQLNVYPNPAATRLNISCSLKYPCKDLRAQLIDMSGKVVLQAQTGNNLIEMDTHSLPSGNYTVNIIADGKRYAQHVAIRN